MQLLLVKRKTADLLQTGAAGSMTSALGPVHKDAATEGMPLINAG